MVLWRTFSLARLFPLSSMNAFWRTVPELRRIALRAERAACPTVSPIKSSLKKKSEKLQPDVRIERRLESELAMRIR